MKPVIAVLILFCSQISVFIAAAFIRGDINHSEDDPRRRLSIEWENVYPGITSSTVSMDCNHMGKKICCSALKGQHERINGVPVDLVSSLSREGECITTKEYFPSPYESRHIMKAKEIANAGDLSTRYRMLVEFISSQKEIIAAQKWLSRVKTHMRSNDIGHKSHANIQRLREKIAARKRGKGRRTTVSQQHSHHDDEEYMSKFVVSTSCSGGFTNKWVEWIEPLSVHARHPFSMSHCQRDNVTLGELMAQSGIRDIPRESMFSVDHILIQSSKSLTKHEITPSRQVRQTQTLLFDAGTSRFDSSLFWFTCAYSQKKIEFDKIYGWEMSLLDPVPFWDHVPSRWKPLYQFFNKGISDSPSSDDSVQTFLRQLGVTANDFVAFKLDIDTPTIEIPIALELLNTSSDFSQLVDEFFFELHFRCEILMVCGWDDEMPEDFMGMHLQRYDAMKFFSDLRHRGIRSHFWP